MYKELSAYQKHIVWTFILFGVLLFPFSSAEAEVSTHPVLYLFWGEGCPHCEAEKEFLEQLHTRYPELEMRWFEIWDHPEFRKLADAMRKAYGIKGPASVPLTFIGEVTMTGYLSEETTGIEIEEQVITCLREGCVDALEKVKFLTIVERIHEEAAQNAPKDWQFFPSVLQTQKQQ